jgi:hypothetical protein
MHTKIVFTQHKLMSLVRLSPTEETQTQNTYPMTTVADASRSNRRHKWVGKMDEQERE